MVAVCLQDRWEHQHLSATSNPSGEEVVKLAGNFSRMCSVFAEQMRHPSIAPLVLHCISVRLSSVLETMNSQVKVRLQ